MTNLVLSPIDPTFLINSIAEKTASEVLRRLSEKEPNSLQEAWFNLKQFCSYHPDKPKESTVYGWVSNRRIPFHKDGKRLRFLKSEVDEYLRRSKVNTVEEIKLEVEKTFEAKRGAKL
jgi:excisionase family DNA binding protein